MRRCLGAAVLALAILAVAAAPSMAQPRGAGVPTARDGVKAPETPSAPVLAVVSIARQRVSIYGESHGEVGLLAQSPVSTGMPGYRTPPGVFSVLQKRRYHESNIYSGAPMPFMQRLTWSGIALHAGQLPGYPASHGCIRLPHHFAVQLWGMTKIGTRVVVAPDDAPVLPIEHPRLPVPRLAPADDGNQPPEDAPAGAPGPELSAAVGLRLTDANDELAARGLRLLDPLQRVKAARAFAVQDAAAKVKAARQAALAAADKAKDGRHGLAALRSAEAALAAARRRQEATARIAAAASGTPAAERAGAALADADEDLGEAQRVADAARLIEAALSQEAAEAAMTASETEDLRRTAEAAVKATERSAEPISIFVSRKAERVLIRQAWSPIHEAPVRFLEGGPLGTHVYLAMGSAGDSEPMRWLSVSMPSSARGSPRPRERHAGPAPAVPAPGHETAAGALARFELLEAARKLIADRLWAGATLVVSDQGSSGETGVGTDFIVITR
jgi:hypothetical protein